MYILSLLCVFPLSSALNHIRRYSKIMETAPFGVREGYENLSNLFILISAGTKREICEAKVHICKITVVQRALKGELNI